jgi:hypothetical protein
VDVQENASEGTIKSESESGTLDNQDPHAENNQSYEPGHMQVEPVNEACRALGLSPEKVKNSPVKRRGCAVINKVTQICSSVSCKLLASVEIAEEPINSKEKLKQTDEYQTLISSFQAKMRNTKGFYKKVWLISLLPQL